MTALTDALEASRSKAIAALGKAYVSRTDEPDDELFAGLLVKIGEDDERKIGFLLAAWRILREQRADAPGERRCKRRKRALHWNRYPEAD